MSSDLAIDIQNVSKHYQMYNSPESRLKQMLLPRFQSMFGLKRSQFYTSFSAVENVSCQISRGQTIGIIGRNGSGKSTLLQMVCGILTPSSGRIKVNGRIAALLELGAGFNPEFTGRENVYLNASILGLTHEETKERFENIEAFADIGIFIDQPVKSYSSGMYVRLAFAVATSVDPDILIVDEALAVGDEAFQRKCFARIEEIKTKGGTILFVSHGSQTIVQLCDRAILLDAGEMLLEGEPKTIVAQYQRLVNASTSIAEDVRNDIIANREKLQTSTNLSPPHFHRLEFEAGTYNQISTVQNKSPLLHRPPSNNNDSLIALIKNDEIDTYSEFDFDPDLVSKSIVELEQQGASIHDVMIVDANDRQVNILKFGKAYSYIYNVTFEKEASSVSFGMLIKTISGIELAGATNENPQYTRIPVAQSGDTLEVRFDFTCRLMPGKYFVNAGVVGNIENDRRHLHRILDAITFRVQDDTSTWDYGYFRMNYKISAKLAQLNAKSAGD